MASTVYVVVHLVKLLFLSYRKWVMKTNNWDAPKKLTASGNLSLVFHNPPVIYLLRKCLDPLKAEPREVFGVPNTDPHKVFGRLGMLGR